MTVKIIDKSIGNPRISIRENEYKKLVFRKFQNVNRTKKIYDSSKKLKKTKTSIISVQKNIKQIEREKSIYKLMSRIANWLDSFNFINTDMYDKKGVLWIQIRPRSYPSGHYLVSEKINYTKFREPYDIIKAFDKIEKNQNYNFYVDNMKVREMIVDAF